MSSQQNSKLGSDLQILQIKLREQEYMNGQCNIDLENYAIEKNKLSRQKTELDSELHYV